MATEMVYGPHVPSNDPSTSAHGLGLLHFMPSARNNHDCLDAAVSFPLMARSNRLCYRYQSRADLITRMFCSPVFRFG